jgi:ATP-binding cassette subfamily F protein 3
MMRAIFLQAGYRMGVVGRDGAGKSSLFAALMSEVEPHSGDIDLPGKARIASVAQETPHQPDPAIDFVLSGDADLDAAIQMEANAFAAEDWEAVAEADQRPARIQSHSCGRRRPVTSCRKVIRANRRLNSKTKH